MAETETGELGAPEPAPAPAAPEAPTSRVLREWGTEFLHNSPVSRAGEAYHHLFTVALPELERRLKELL